jgi:predicted metal-dependent hydrolase
MSLPAWTVRRSTRARRARITVTDDGRVVVVLPRRAPLEVAEILMREHEAWVRRHVAMARRRRASIDDRPGLAEGRVLDLNGVPHRIRILPSASARSTVRRSLDTDEDGIRGVIEVRAPDDLAARRALEGYLRTEARQLLEARVAALAPMMAVTAGPVIVRDQRSRWGSASRRGSLSFSWRLLLAPTFVLDAVVVHELAHLRHADHSTRFWALARTHAPRTDEARRWLRANRHVLRAALD